MRIRYGASILVGSFFFFRTLCAADTSPSAGVGSAQRQSPVKLRHGPVRPVDLAAFPDTFHSEFVAGPGNGLDSAYLVVSRVPPHGEGPPLHTHAVDQLYYVLSGQMNVQLGTDTFVVNPDTLVFIPAGTPHHNWNSGSVPEVHVEIIVPAPPMDGISKPAQPRKIANAASLIRPLALNELKGSVELPGFATQWLARRENGSSHLALNIGEVQPGSGGPGLHIHAVDQIYFVIRGTMKLQLGLKQYEAKANTFVIIPAGTVHRQWNEGPGVEKHLTLLIPEPHAGQPIDVAVELKGEVAGGRSGNGNPVRK
jgi:mannose-6-phosphate isomerase-like protein (cupin superfamily)